MSYSDYKNNASAKDGFTVHISGIPYVFCTDDIGATVSIQSQSHAVHPIALRESIRETPGGWQMRDGKGTPGTFEVDLANIVSATYSGGFLAWLTSTDLSSTGRTYLIGENDGGLEEIGYGTGAGQTWYVNDYTGLSSSGVAYIGLETIAYTGKNAGVYNELTGVTRARYGSLGYRHPTEGDTDPELYMNPLVTSHPIFWQGRYVTVYRYFWKVDGTVSTASAVWRGVLQELKPIGDGQLYRLTAKDLTSVMDRELAGTPTTAPMRFNGDSFFYYLDSGWVAKDPKIRLEWSGGTVRTYTYNSYDVGVKSNIISIIPYYDYSGGWSGGDAGGFMMVLESDDGSLRAGIRNLESSTMVRFEAPGELMNALGFDGSVVYGIGGNETFFAPNPMARFFTSAYSNRLYVEDIDTIDIPTLSGAQDFGIVVKCIRRGVTSYEVMAVDGVGDDGTYDYIGITRRGISNFGSITGKGALHIWSDEEDGIEIRGCLISKNTSGKSFARSVITSTDGSGMHGNWDVVPIGFGAVLPDSYILNADWIKDDGGEARDYMIMDPETVSDLVSSEFQISTLRLRMVDGKLGIYRVGVTGQAESQILIDDSDILETLSIPVVPDAALQISTVKYKVNWDPAEQEFEDGDILVQSVAAKSMDMAGATMEISHKGIRWSRANAFSFATEQSSAIFDRFAITPYIMGPLSVPICVGCDIYEGSVLGVTHDQILNPYTAQRGVSQLLCQVWKKETDWQGNVVRLWVFVQRQTRKISTYAPCAQVVSYNSGTGDLVVSEHEFTMNDTADSLYDKDIAYFSAGDRVKIIEASTPDETSTLTVELVSVTESTNTMNIGAGKTLSGGAAPSSGDVVKLATYNHGSLPPTADQKKRCFIANNSDLLGATDACFIFG